MRTVYITADNGNVIVDHATTDDMGAMGYADREERELAESYARFGIAQARRKGYADVAAHVTHYGTGRRTDIY